MKNTIIRLLTATVLTGGVLGCNDRLNVQPVTQIDASNALNTSNDVQAALVGCYNGLQSVYLYGGYIQFMSDLLADNGDEAFVGTFSQPQEAQRKTLLVNDATIANTWLDAYSTINRANNVLANTSKLSTAALKSSVEGEALFIRSLLYFDLVRLYARNWADGTPSANPGVPLVLTPTTTISSANNVARNTVAEVYAQVISDLTKAEAELPVTNGFFATRYSAAALLARIYLQQGNYAAAAAAANRVIASNRYQLNTSYGDNFLSNSDLLANSPEDVFAIQVSSQSGTNQLNTFYSQYSRNDVDIQPQFINAFETGDDRKNVYEYDATYGLYYTNKYDVLYGNIKLIRLDELYLIRAEANFRAGTSVGASPLADINLIRDRALLPPLTTLTLAAIQKERRLELAFEGFRLADLKRYQQSTIDPTTGASIPWNSPRLIFPIPLREINANPNLVQNAGY
ncbi:RagB/SusD family nutrient uptake outer membrane protein [Hymenobacter sp. RP-2-7]|uniref:RagB/SusD family nutrient uptake outer membrane protein n=1 Tax=Hymenobacter polaris TaxID=2682546 RepID=A0A7Y0AHG7_9BACT|nr:RagB/SusD family nutrient uptake outer membrane protein [Hymenobacter polaris]NML67466.1 RagB/SusD family nutrient uptake outer membrane protein [Hymenobacter polaris]